jgi:glycerol uptake facilitator-like aquaporin
VNQTLTKRLAAETVGTAMLLAAVVGSGIMGERLAAGNVALALLANSIATGSVLAALILTFGSISGSHFNPAVTLVSALQKEIVWTEVPVYIGSQIIGALAGVAIAHVMFAAPLFSASSHTRRGLDQLFAEFVATFGLLAVIRGCAKYGLSTISLAVAAYITGAYWFTGSTSFANPAVTIGRTLTDTFSGIRPVDAPGFVCAQFVGAMTATVFFRWLDPQTPTGNRK